MSDTPTIHGTTRPCPWPLRLGTLAVLFFAGALFDFDLTGAIHVGAVSEAIGVTLVALVSVGCWEVLRWGWRK